MQKENIHALLVFIKNKEVNLIRKRFDKRPIKTHLTLVYPFQPKNIIIKKLQKFLKSQSSFEISFEGFGKSKKDYYLYFLVNKNKDKLLRLHKELYKLLGLKFNNFDMLKYIPHISLGIFDSKEAIDKELKKLNKKDYKFNYLIDEVSLVTLGYDWKSKSIKNFKLK